MEKHKKPKHNNKFFFFNSTDGPVCGIRGKAGHPASTLLFLQKLIDIKKRKNNLAGHMKCKLHSEETNFFIPFSKLPRTPPPACNIPWSEQTCETQLRIVSTLFPTSPHSIFNQKMYSTRSQIEHVPFLSAKYYPR